MFSLDKFYNILHHNLISQFPNGKSISYYPFGTYDAQRIYYDSFFDRDLSELPNIGSDKITLMCFFVDQEPLYDNILDTISHTATDFVFVKEEVDYYVTLRPRRILILANSEKSELKNKLLKKGEYQDWYYFFHGFAALHWYRDYQYVNPKIFEKFSKVFICYNHLISNYRSYRLHLISNLVEHNLVKQGYVSYFLKDSYGTWQDAVNDPYSLLDQRAKDKIITYLPTVTEPIIIDTNEPKGALSAELDIDRLTDAFWHIVTETIYFHPKLHLTEKVFKPIVAQRPFMLVAAPGNLAYLRSYGFKTFDRWIDESYDTEQDHYVRIEKITAELARLCALTPNELKQMHQEMQEVLLHNYNHFYGDFKRIIVDELVDNFEGILMQINNGRMPNNHSRHHQRFELCKDYYNEVKQRLLK